MATISIRVSAAEKVWLQRMAEFYGLSLSTLIMTYSFEQLEDTYDALIAESVYKYYHAKDQSTVSMAQVLAEFGGGDGHKL
ncbi:type II toxin-antitoxin system RelB family antitoxin [Levilactobacillus lanxiensis]|uniref:Type II toxin-antitoxin system RelB family antitoxin n=1 Tax=Levilactobacillus lanxiensis TaxID=2799568 RepID=A0ABW4D007_9LACO|nr:DUF6290 family protein [Levilactobacillus lanxiensis]